MTFSTSRRKRGCIDYTSKMRRGALRHAVASGAVLAALVSIIDFATAGTTSLQGHLLGCWKQTSPYPAKEIPADKTEWGTRTWCFRPRGVLETSSMACGRSGGCDGWDKEWHYRWRGANLELEDYSYDDRGNNRQRIWRRCLPIFSKDQFILTDCEMSKDPFVRDKDPNKTE
jgi:hypothetical protein